MADTNGKLAPDAGKDKDGGQSALATKKDDGKGPESTKTVDDGKGNDDRPRPRFNYRDEIRRLQGNLEAAESDAANATEELNKLRGQIKDCDGELRKQIVAAEERAKDADAIAKKAVADAKAIEAKAQDAIVAAEKKATATATAEPPKGPGTQPEPKRPDPPTPRTETQPRQPDPPHPTRIDNCGDDGRGQCCCHPFTRTWFWATVAAVLLIAFGAGIWWFSGTTATTTSPTAIMAPAPVDPLAADKGEFLIQCQSQGGTFEDCLNGFEAVTR